MLIFTDFNSFFYREHFLQRKNDIYKIIVIYIKNNLYTVCIVVYNVRSIIRFSKIRYLLTDFLESLSTWNLGFSVEVGVTGVEFSGS